MAGSLDIVIYSDTCFLLGREASHLLLPTRQHASILIHPLVRVSHRRRLSDSKHRHRSVKSHRCRSGYAHLESLPTGKVKADAPGSRPNWPPTATTPTGTDIINRTHHHHA